MKSQDHVGQFSRVEFMIVAVILVLLFAMAYPAYKKVKNHAIERAKMEKKVK